MRELTAKEIQLMARLEENERLRPFFFRKANGLHWFNPLEEAGYFKPENNPTPVENEEKGTISIPLWPAVQYLVNSREELGKPDNVEFAAKAWDVIVTATQFAKDKGYSNYRTWWAFGEITQALPVETISVDDLWVVDYWLDDPFETSLVGVELGKWLSSLLDSGDQHSLELALVLIGKVFKIVFEDKDGGQFERKHARLKIDDYHMQKTIEKSSKKIGDKLGIDGVDVFKGLLEQIVQETASDNWSSIWRPAIAEHEQNSTRSARGLVLSSFRDVLDGYVEANKQKAQEYVESLFKSEFETIHRVLVHVIDIHFDYLGSGCNLFLNERYFSANFRHEVWTFLNNHYGKLEQAQREKVLSLIESIEVRREDEESNEEATSYRRAIWLSAIKGFGEAEKELYSRYTEICGEEPEHPEFSSFSTVGWSKRESPVAIDELLSMSPEDLIASIERYEDDSSFDEPGIEGFVEAWKQVVKTKPEEMASHLKDCLNFDLAFTYNTFKAYRELWEEKKKINWDDILGPLVEFAHELVQLEAFWAEENAKPREDFVATRHWVVGAIAELLESGTQADENAFPEGTLKESLAILELLLEKQEGEEFKEDSDAVFVSINSPRGKCIEALINQCLRECRLADKAKGHHDDVWKRYQGVFESEQKRREIGEYEFATLVGNYIANFSYMSKDWTSANIPNFFDPSDKLALLFALQGFSYTRLFNNEVYSYLKGKQLLIPSLDNPIQRKGVKEKLIEYIAFSFLSGKEEYDGSVVKELIERGHSEELSQMIWFVKIIKDQMGLEMKGQVFFLWSRLLDSIDFESKAGKGVASDLCSWAVFVPEINEDTYPLLEAVAPYANINHRAYGFMSWLAEIGTKQPIEAQRLWLRLISRETDYLNSEHIETLFKALIDYGREGAAKAREVANIYAEQGDIVAYDAYSKLMGDEGEGG